MPSFGSGPLYTSAGASEDCRGHPRPSASFRNPGWGCFHSTETRQEPFTAGVLIIRRLAARAGGPARAATIRTTLLGSYGRLFLGAFMPVAGSVAPDLGDCNHGGVAFLGIALPNQATRSTRWRDCKSLAPGPSRVNRERYLNPIDLRPTTSRASYPCRRRIRLFGVGPSKKAAGVGGSRRRP